MAPLEVDNLVKEVDRIMAEQGFSRERMHITGKRVENLPDLMMYKHDASGQSVGVGIEDEVMDGRTVSVVSAKLPREEGMSWDSIEAFKKGLGPWVRQNL